MKNRIRQYYGDEDEPSTPPEPSGVPPARPQNMADLREKLDVLEHHLADENLSEEIRILLLEVRAKIVEMMRE